MRIQDIIYILLFMLLISCFLFMACESCIEKYCYKKIDRKVTPV